MSEERRKTITLRADGVCRVCGGAMAKGESALFHQWGVDVAHVACGWVNAEERAVLAKVEQGAPLTRDEDGIARRLHIWAYLFATYNRAPRLTMKGRRELLRQDAESAKHLVDAVDQVGKAS